MIEHITRAIGITSYDCGVAKSEPRWAPGRKQKTMASLLVALAVLHSFALRVLLNCEFINS